MSECCDTQPPRFLTTESISILSDLVVCIFSYLCYPSASHANHVISTRVSSKVVAPLIRSAQTSSWENIDDGSEIKITAHNSNVRPTKPAVEYHFGAFGMNY